MPSPRTILALGAFAPDRRKRIETAARETGFEIVVHDTTESAVKWIDSGMPRVVLFDTAVAKAHSLCLRVRSKKVLSAVPVIAMSRAIPDSALSKLFAAGVDDIVAVNSLEALRRRLRVVPVDESLQPPPDRGVAVVADADHDRCAVIGRTMMNAGYEVRFAVERRTLEHYASSGDVRLVVASAELGPAAEMVEASRLGGCEAPWIITDIERDVAAGAEVVREARGAVVVSAYIPPDCLLFVSNDLISNTGASKRAHQRVLHGTSVSFREAGSAEDDIGFTYNVSLEGLFIRTLAPPSDTKVWIEVTPPGQRRRVRLVGEVRWTRPFSPGKFAITPPGFGVLIRDGLGEDLKLWAESIEKLVASARRRRSVNELLEETLRDSWIEPVPAEAVAPPSLPPLKDLDPLAAKAAATQIKHPPAPRPGESRAPSAMARSATPKPFAAHKPPAASKQAKTLLGLGLPVADRKEATTPEPPPRAKLPSEPKVPESQPRTKLASDPNAFDPKPSVPKQAAFDATASVPEQKAVEAEPAAPAPGGPPMITLEDLLAAEEQPAPAPVVAAQPVPARTEAAAPVVAVAAAPKPASNKRVVALLIVLGVVVGAAVAIVFLALWKPSSLPPPMIPAARPSATAAPSAVAPAMQSPPAPPSASASAATPPSSSPTQASASAHATAAAAPPEVPDGPDGSDLLSMEGYLIVKSSAQLDVYATGLKVGKTNARNKSRCGMKFVRLGEGDPPKWKTDGATVTIACRGVTRISLEPK